MVEIVANDDTSHKNRNCFQYHGVLSNDEFASVQVVAETVDDLPNGDDVVEKIDWCGDDAVDDFSVKNAIDVKKTP